MIECSYGLIREYEQESEYGVRFELMRWRYGRLTSCYGSIESSTNLLWVLTVRALGRQDTARVGLVGKDVGFPGKTDLSSYAHILGSLRV